MDIANKRRNLKGLKTKDISSKKVKNGDLKFQNTASISFICKYLQDLKYYKFLPKYSNSLKKILQAFDSKFFFCFFFPALFKQ